MTTFNLNILTNIRIIRNKLGAHIDRNDSFDDIMLLLKNHDFNNTISIYKNFLNIFYKICNNTFYLKGLAFLT